MGIKQLLTLIGDTTTTAVTQSSMDIYAGKVLACNASMIIYQSVIATRFSAQIPANSFSDDSGITSAHIVGLLNKNAQFLDMDIRPIWVFDGKVPELKGALSVERRESRAKNTDGQGLVYHPTSSDSEGEGKSPTVSLIYKQLIQKKRSIVPVRELEVEFAARHSKFLHKNVIPITDCPDYCCIAESDSEEYPERELFGFLEGLKKQSDPLQVRQALRIAREMTEDAIMLLTLLGVPVVIAPAEADAMCAALVASGRAYAVASEDMDALAFGAKILIRGLNSEKKPVTEINLDRVLGEWGISMQEFVDLTILLGCDYCPSINGAGPNTALKLIRTHHTLEEVLNWITANKKKWTVPDHFPYQQARQVFLSPEIWPPLDLDLAWTPPDHTQLTTFLMTTKGFSLTKVDYGLRKAKKLQSKPMQKKLDCYFGEGKRMGAESPPPVKRPKF